MVDLNLGPVLTAVGTGVVRSFGGWLENALGEVSDGGKKITRFELAKLGETIVRVGLTTVALFYGIEGIFGVDINVLSAGAGAFVLDLLIKAFKKK